jgi:hypothetical protein
MSTEKQEILSHALYDAKELAEMFGFDRVESIYEIPEDELIPTRVGARRGRKKFLGLDVLRYLAAGRPRNAPALEERRVA